MLLDYAGFYGEETKPKQVPWVPQPVPRARGIPGPARVTEPEPEPHPERQVVRGTVELGLPMLRVEAVATASTIPPTRVTDLDLDAQDSGIAEDELVALMAAVMLLEDEDD